MAFWKTEKGYWQQRSAEVLDKVDKDLPHGADFKTVKKAYFDAYPFGEREMHPYKMWCKVVGRRLMRFPEYADKRNKQRRDAETARREANYVALPAAQAAQPQIIQKDLFE